MEIKPISNNNSHNLCPLYNNGIFTQICIHVYLSIHQTPINVSTSIIHDCAFIDRYISVHMYMYRDEEHYVCVCVCVILAVFSADNHRRKASIKLATVRLLSLVGDSCSGACTQTHWPCGEGGTDGVLAAVSAVCYRPSIPYKINTGATSGCRYLSTSTLTITWRQELPTNTDTSYLQSCTLDTAISPAHWTWACYLLVFDTLRQCTVPTQSS